MKRLLVIICVVLMVAALAYARAPKSDYQWTGTVVEVDDDHIIVQKGNDKWEFAHDKDTKKTGEIKAGSKVTVKYLMKATGIEGKEEPKKAEPKKAEPKKK